MGRHPMRSVSANNVGGPAPKLQQTKLIANNFLNLPVSKLPDLERRLFAPNLNLNLDFNDPKRNPAVHKLFNHDPLAININCRFNIRVIQQIIG